MKAMLLAAGVGERMRPLTLGLPKPLVPVLGRPLAHQILARMASHGFDSTVLNLHHLPEMIRDALGEGGQSGLPRIRYSHESVILGTAGGLREAGSLLRGDGPILVHNADFLADIDLLAVLRAHRDSECLATLVLAPPRPGYSVIEVDSAGRVLSLAGEPHAAPDRVAGTYLFTGCHVVSEDVLDLIPAGRPSDIVRHVYRGLAEESKLGAFIHPGFWWEFGSPELYLEGSLRLLGCGQDRLRAISGEHDPIREIGAAMVAVGPGATHHDSARFHGRVALGMASNVSQECVIEDSVVMPESWIGPGCRLRRSIIGKGVELPAGFHADQVLVCLAAGATEGDLPPQTRRSDGLLIRSFDG